VGIVSASNLSPTYARRIPWFIRFWSAQKSTLQGVIFTPVVVLAAKEVPPYLKKYQDNCVVFDSDIPDVFASQNIRIYYPAIANFDVIMTSDIDMFPISTRVIDAALESLSGQPPFDFVVARDVLPEGQFPICYSVASSATWKKLHSVENLEDISKSLRVLFDSRVRSDLYSGQHGAYAWFTDQENLYQLVTSLEEKLEVSIARLSDSQTLHRRLDREYHNGFLRWRLLRVVVKGLFTDYHSHLPRGTNLVYFGFLLLATKIANMEYFVNRRKKIF